MFFIRQLVCSFSCLLFFSNAFCCMNDYYRTAVPFKDNKKLDLHALIFHEEEANPYWSNGFAGDMVLEDKRTALRRIGFAKLGFKDQSDYAVIELKVGDKNKGLKILEDLYRKYPREYNIVANLGTAYELTGNNEKALELLEKAVAINPASHHHSEWIHVNILRQKIAAKPDYKAIINLRSTDFATWVIDKKYVFPQPANSLKIQIAYQLHERIAFIPPPDPIIGQLVLDFADIVAKTDSLEAAIPFYDYAVKYDPSLHIIVVKRKLTIQEERKVVKDTFTWASVIWGVPLIAFALIFVAWIRSRRKAR